MQYLRVYIHGGGIIMAWVVKNKDGSETIYEVKPYKYNDEWISRKDGWERTRQSYIKKIEIN